jgi:hypothetical protein
MEDIFSKRGANVVLWSACYQYAERKGMVSQRSGEGVENLSLFL